MIKHSKNKVLAFNRMKKFMSTMRKQLVNWWDERESLLIIWINIVSNISEKVSSEQKGLWIIQKPPNTKFEEIGRKVKSTSSFVCHRRDLKEIWNIRVRITYSRNSFIDGFYFHSKENNPIMWEMCFFLSLLMFPGEGKMENHSSNEKFIRGKISS